MSCGQTLVQDVFDGNLRSELEPLYGESVWSSLNNKLKEKMTQALENALIASNMEVVIAPFLLWSYNIPFIIGAS